jgi:hypothetical protein
VAQGNDQAPVQTEGQLPVQPGAPVPALAGSPVPARTPGVDHKPAPHPVEPTADPAQPGATVAIPLEHAASSVTPAGVPIATPSAAVAAPHSTAPASPAEQVAPALLTLAKTADGGQQMTVRLQPGDLGMVQVRIARTVSGATQVEITAQNSTTLLALQRDQPQLHRTLDDAGIPAAGRTVTFHVAQAVQAAAGSGSGPSTGHGGTEQGLAGRTGAGATDADGSASGGRGSYPARERNAYPTGRRAGTPPAAADAQAATAGQTYRIGLDITA